MQFLFESQAQESLSGIYKITNTINSRVYIGQCKKFFKRWNRHKNALLARRHHNKFLQSDFNKCMENTGSTDFLCFSVVEILEQAPERNLAEERHIAAVYNKKLEDNSRMCYNLKKTPGDRDCSGFSSGGEETRRKQSVASRRNWEDPEYRTRVLKAISSVVESLPYKEKIRNKTLEHWQDPEYREKVTSRSREALNTDEAKEKRSAISKKNWKNPEMRERILQNKKDTCSSEEYRKNMSAIKKEAWKDSEMREKQSSSLRALWADPVWKAQCLEKRKQKREAKSA